MKASTMACLAAAALLAACGSKDAGTSDGTGAASGANPNGYAGGLGGPGGAGAYGAAGRAAPGTQEDLVQTAGDRIFFSTDQSIVNDQARATLDRQAQWLQQNASVSIWVAGNCDERGTEEYNLALGQRRANAARDYLVAHGVARNRIETISFGKSRPVDGASTPEAWSKNRNAIMSVR